MSLFLILSLAGLGVCIVQAILIRGYHIMLRESYDENLRLHHENFHLREAVSTMIRRDTEK